MEFSLCLLFAKLVSYTFLYWLPLYIVNVGESQEATNVHLTTSLCVLWMEGSHSPYSRQECAGFPLRNLAHLLLVF